MDKAPSRQNRINVPLESREASDTNYSRAALLSLAIIAPALAASPQAEAQSKIERYYMPGKTWTEGIADLKKIFFLVLKSTA